MGIFDKLRRQVAGEEKEAAKQAEKKEAPKAKAKAAAKPEKKMEKKEAKKKADAAKNAKKRSSSRVTEDVLGILKAPAITEKATILQEGGKYVFHVDKKATKQSVNRAVSALYRVEVDSVNILNRKGKQIKNWRMRGAQSDVKKAIVTVAKGETIQLYDQEETK